MSDAEVTTGRPRRAQRSDGIRSREAILHEAARLATVEGLEGLSIGHLADAVGMSKSGLYAHFGSKEELQLATIETASAVFFEQVVEPAQAAADALGRLRGLFDGFLDHVERGVYPGGCFFASVAAELDTHPGPVRDLAIGVTEEWMQLIAATVRQAQTEGGIDPGEDADQLAFEIDGYMLMANALFVARPSTLPLDRARKALATRLAAVAPTQP
jgi:AcrR family transcriptional regulator